MEHIKNVLSDQIKDHGIIPGQHDYLFHILKGHIPPVRQEIPQMDDICSHIYCNENRMHENVLYPCFTRKKHKITGRCHQCWNGAIVTHP